jgi:hypothetical protein
MAHENDVVLIYFEDKPSGFARIEDISPDVKKEWYNVTLLLLQIPLQTITWTLKDVYIDGEEFTMNGNRMRLELVESLPGSIPIEKDEAPEKNITSETNKSSEDDNTSENDKPAKIISLADRKSK